MDQLNKNKFNSSCSQWKSRLRQNFTSWQKLAAFLELNESQCEQILKSPSFILNLPLRLAQKIRKGTLDDPILKQFLPLQEEKQDALGFFNDPVEDHACRKSVKLLQKYQGRVLLICTSACAMHCRYCFRQHFDYPVQEKSFDDELSLIAEDPSIHEVILSGGDPLSLSDDILKDLLIRLSKIPHIKRIRFHTRFLMGIPERIDESFLAIFDHISCQIWFVIHANHPLELDKDVLSSLDRLREKKIMLLNQAVLLKGVNDDAETLVQLCEMLVNHGVLPYYLHQLDRVKGAAHFEVSEEEGRHLIAEISKYLPGYAVPKYVREIAGEPGKTLIL